MGFNHRGRNVLLHFFERAHCPSCLVQMAVEKSVDITSMDVTVLPIVMNTREQCRAKWRRAGLGRGGGA